MDRFTRPNTLSRFLCILIVLFFLYLPDNANCSENPQDGYIFGVFPFLPCSNLEGVFAPIASELSKSTGKPVSFRLTSSYSAFVSALKEERFDIVHVHPFDYIQYAASKGYIPLVARVEPLYAQFSSKTGSSIQQIKDLKGKRLGTPPPTGAVTYLAKSALQKAGLTPGKDVTLKYYPNHLACLQNLQIGTVDACVTSASSLKTFESQLNIKLQRIGASVSIPHSLFAVHKRVPPADIEKFRNTLMTSTFSQIPPKLRSLFIESASATSGRYFRPVEDKDYNQVRTIIRQIEK
mgnify:FL=1